MNSPTPSACHPVTVTPRQPVTPNRPHEHVRILLSKAASDALLAAGSCFIVAARATSPDDGSRVALHFVPCSFERANDAVSVARGNAKATKPRPAKP